MYYSEIGRIIEAGLERDRDKVVSFAQLLAKKMAANGDEKGSKRIRDVLERKSSNKAVTDPFIAHPPVDQESRMHIVEIEYNPSVNDLILSKAVEDKLMDFMGTIKNKDKLEQMGLEFNMSLLLYGYPGCGKTSVAKYIAAQLGLPLVVARLDTLISSLLGNTSKNIHKIFEFAKKQPCVLFLDEFDAIGKARDAQHELGELKRVVNSLLQNMDEYCRNGILIAATNHHELLDCAIWRRFQAVIQMPKPELAEIEKMINNLPDFIDVSQIKPSQWKKVYDTLLGLSYSDIKNILNNMVKKLVLKDEHTVKLTDILVEVYWLRNYGNYTMEQLVQYMIENGVSQKQAAIYFNVSTRQIKNCLGKLQYILMCLQDRLKIVWKGVNRLE